MTLHCRIQYDNHNALHTSFIFWMIQLRVIAVSDIFVLPVYFMIYFLSMSYCHQQLFLCFVLFFEGLMVINALPKLRSSHVTTL